VTPEASGFMTVDVNTPGGCGAHSSPFTFYSDFNLDVPSSGAVKGLAVLLDDAYVDYARDPSTSSWQVELSWNGGSTWTAPKSTGNLPTWSRFASTSQDFTLGGGSDDWGHDWSGSEFSNVGFRLRIQGCTTGPLVSDTSTGVDTFLDSVAVKVFYTLDQDLDGVNDDVDNCPSVANGDQANNDADAQGDACDADDDNDGLLDVADNCRLVANADQRDTDGDGAGDVCDNVFNSTDGRASGGGFLVQDGEKVNFSVSGKSEAGRLFGTCVVTAGSTTIKCTGVDGFYKSGTNRVVMVGSATVDGTPTRDRIDLTDNGEPGTSDRIAIQTDSGFAAAGTISGGNLEVHK
jgi:hypothetical protein